MVGLQIFSFLLLSLSSSAFVIPFKILPDTSITEGGQALTEVREFFVANLTVGTPGQLFTVFIDLLSADLIIPDVTCVDECNDKHRFNSSLSSSYISIETPEIEHNIHDIDGNFLGFIGKDTAVIGDKDSESITIPNVKFLRYSSERGSLDRSNIDGVLGLGFSTQSKINGTAPFVLGVQQGDIADSFFSIWLEHYGQTDDLGTHGVIYYGGLDSAHCAPNPQYIPLSSARQFQVTLSNFVASSGNQTNTVSRNYQAIFDSTSRFILAPRTYVNAVLQSLGITTDTTHFPINVDCSSKISLTFTFAGGVVANITERDLINKDADGTCLLLLVPDNNNFIALGTTFLRGRCTYFDLVREQIGITPALLQD